MRWLNDDEQRAWRAYLEATQRLFGRLEADLEDRAGLGQGDYEILVRLSEAPDGRLRMSDLATDTVFSRSRLSHAVTRLEGRGLVERRTCDSDRRGTFAALTAMGRKVLEAAAPGHVTCVREHVFDQLSEAEVRAMHRIFDKVRRSLP